MSCTKKPWLISRFLSDHLNSSKFMTQEITIGLGAIAQNSYAAEKTWSFLRFNWELVREKYKN